MDNLAMRHKKWNLVPEQKMLFYQKRYAEEVEQELQRISATISWSRHAGWPEIRFARILADHEIEDLILENESLLHPIEILCAESGKGLFVKKPGEPVKLYHQTFLQMKKRLTKREA